MAFSATNRWGACYPNPRVNRLRQLLQSIDITDDEHTDVSLKHETEWCLSAFPSGRLVWENVEDEEDNPRHMVQISRERVLDLWLKLARGDLAQ
jgi:hypothetical protein